MYQIFNTAQNDEDNRICLHKLPTSLIIEFDAPVYIINIFQSAKLKKKKKEEEFHYFYMNDIYSDISIFDINCQTWNDHNFTWLERTEIWSNPFFHKKITATKKYQVIPKILFIFSFFVFQLFFQNLDRSYLDDTLSFIRYFIR